MLIEANEIIFIILNRLTPNYDSAIFLMDYINDK